MRHAVNDAFGPGYWDGFEDYMATDLPWHEWRFGGQLGFGGKVNLGGGRLYVSCYPEDRSPGIDLGIERLNERLAEVIHAA